MSSFCRITGYAKNLPKPHYFPLLPPISPADAKKLCRITGKSGDTHNFCPIISFGKPIKSLGVAGCKITKFKDFSFTMILFEKTKENEKSFYFLEEVLSNMKKKKDKCSDFTRQFAYNIEEQKVTLIIPPEIEEGIRCGEIESFSINKNGKIVQVKIKSGRIIRLNLQQVSKEDIESSENIYFGEGQNEDVLTYQQKIVESRQQRKQETQARKKLFEEKEKIEEELEIKSTYRPKSKKPLVMSHKKREEKKGKMEKLIAEQRTNKSLALPKYNKETEPDLDEAIRYEQMLSDLAAAQKVSHSLTVCATEIDWRELEKAAQGFDWESFQNDDEPVAPFSAENQKAVDPLKLNLSAQLGGLDIVAAVETIVPPSTPDIRTLKAINQFKDEQQMQYNENVDLVIKKLNCEDVIARSEDIANMSANMSKADVGYLVQNNGTMEFIKKADFKEGQNEVEALAGAFVELDDKSGKKFVLGQVINIANKETFVAGQTMDIDGSKKFFPGHTFITEDGSIKFIPGQDVETQEGKMFQAGQTVNSPDGLQFVPGQTIDRGDGKQTFISGQTIRTDEGLKFVPGDIVKDEDGFDCFVPGMPMPSDGIDKFVPGQTFQDETGNMSFTPGQIVDTVEGPIFVPGQTFKTDKGDQKFVKGELMKDSNDKVKFVCKERPIPSSKEELIIPSEDLVPIAIATKNVIGFLVDPTNTAHIPKGESLLGDIVETDDAVLFYLENEIPEDVLQKAQKIIPGKLSVGEDEQRFIPGRVLKCGKGEEKFEPGQLVMTSHGEEFVPGQIVETVNGPKFVPGQIIETSNGDKFVPGQVIVEESGPKFVPGQIIQTKNGSTFIPGQMMNTTAGQKFVPGQLVECIDGPRFVLGQVIETSDGPKFTPGTVIETEEGLKYVPHEAEEDGEDIEIAFQGFEVTPEEMQLLSFSPADNRVHSPISNDQCLIDSRTLKRVASVTLEAHGATPEPISEGKKNKKSKKRVALDAPDEEDLEPDEPQEIDEGTDKVEILKHMYDAANTMSNVKRTREMKKLLPVMGLEDNPKYPVQCEAIVKICSTKNENCNRALREFIGYNDDLVNDIMIQITSMDNIKKNDDVKDTISKALQSVVTNKCDKEITKIIKKLAEDPDSLMTDTKTQILLTEAVGIVCVTGNVEVAALLEKFISEPTDPSILKDDPDVMTVLRQLLVLHEIADRDEETAKTLQILQTNPEGVKSRKMIRELLKTANQLLVPASNLKRRGEKFDVRHVASSRDIPTDIFEQLKSDQDEAKKFLENLPDELFHAIMSDERISNDVLQGLDQSSDKAKADISKFRSGMAVVVAQASVQAVIPREYARSVIYGIMPYLLIDEQGFKFFERGLTGRKLAPSKIIENTWFKDDDYYRKSLLYPKSGERCSVRGMGRSPSLHYTCLLPTSEPKIMSRDALLQERRASRARRPSVESSRSSRRSSVSSLHGDYSAGNSSYNPVSPSSYHPDPYLPETSNYIPPSTYVPTYSDETYTPLTSSYLATPSLSNGYDDPSVCSAVVPYQPMSDPEESDSTSIKRSDTVGKLLDKYSNFKAEEEFGTKKPDGAYARYLKKYDMDDSVDDINYLSDDSIQPKSNTIKFKPRKLNLDRFSNIFEEDEDLPNNSIPKFDASKESSGGVGNYGSPQVSRKNERRDAFDSNKFDRLADPIADRYKRNVASYDLPSHLDKKYGKSKYEDEYQYQNPLVGDPSPYGTTGVSDSFTPNYCNRYSRGKTEQPSYLIDKPSVTDPLNYEDDISPYESKLDDDLDMKEYENTKKSIGKAKDELASKIEDYLDPKKGSTPSRKNSSSKYSPLPKSRYLRNDDDDDDLDDSPVHRPSVRPYRPISRGLTTPNISGYDNDDDDDISRPSSYTNHLRRPFIPNNYRNLNGYPHDTSTYSGRSNITPADSSRYSSYRSPSTIQRPELSYQSHIRPNYGRFNSLRETRSPAYESLGTAGYIHDNRPITAGYDRPSYFSRDTNRAYTPMSSSIGSGGVYGGNSLSVDAERPWRRHTTSVLPRRPFVAQTYDDEDDDDADYNPKETERALAAKIAKQYISTKSESEDDD